MLAEIYNWFTEGFDTADLKHAKSLLTAWGSCRRGPDMNMVTVIG